MREPASPLAQRLSREGEGAGVRGNRVQQTAGHNPHDESMSPRPCPTVLSGVSATVPAVPTVYTATRGYIFAPIRTNPPLTSTSTPKSTSSPVALLCPIIRARSMSTS
ncbi:MAG: hypothetical protein KatS3mg051_0933 [Anaerolineae bacterium]|nr:MAG: hypothetical protein KatS3mg051_0933 [Anaerolineae bacterium]